MAPPLATALAAAVALLTTASAAAAPAQAVPQPAAATAPSPPTPLRAWAAGRPTFPLASAEEGAAVKFFEGAKPPLNLPKEDLTHEPLDLNYTAPPVATVPWTVAGPPRRPGVVETAAAGDNGGAAAAASHQLEAWYKEVRNLSYPVVAPPAIRRDAERARAAWAEATSALDDGAVEGSGANATAPSLPPPEATLPPVPSNTTGEEGEGVLVDKYDYASVLALALRFFDMQRSGDLPADFPVSWRGDSFVRDAASYGGQPHSVVGGFHDAGDHLKLHLPLGWSLSNLAFAMTTFPAAFPAGSAAFAAAAATLQWGAAYLMKCNLGGGRFVAMVGSEASDHSYWGRPEDAHMDRPVLVVDGPAGKPGSDVVGQAVASLAATAVVLKKADPAFAAECVAAARELYGLATTYEGYYSRSLPVGSMYPSASYLDDLAWAAAWMGRATGDAWFTQRARFYWGRAGAEHPGLAASVQNAWSDAYAGAAVLLASDTGGAEYSAYLWRFCETHLQGAWPVSFTPAGLSYRHQWGSLRVSTGASTIIAAFGSLLAHTDPVTARKYACFARGQVRYALGDTGRSFVVGYGANPPVRAHHRAASCPPFLPGTAGRGTPPCDAKAAFNSHAPNPNVLSGALVGGPSSGDAYEDRRDDYVRNEVALDYQASFVGALAAVVSASDANAGETWASCLSAFGSLRPIKRVVV